MKKSLIFIGLVGIISISIGLYLSFSNTQHSDEHSDLTDESPDYPINEQGQTYGKAPYSEGPVKEPDLIMAEGEDGVIGYVRAIDLDNNNSTPNQSIEDQKEIEREGYRSIPLFEYDGKTVVGEFRIYPSGTGLIQ
ncbi:hypothetical protein BpOF4_21949 (plasmid) [Alkalihalophilus pseudofirmus OF4]|uniref:Peptidase M56 BlaR1 n=1 Tax=Alkalihalophilus pseudofirmus (strain ATCC BAA-2126 / JCM 17055 / OF4) TaxID=398511 RepID=D3G209_ALKPO|nr:MULTISPECIES: hypothetical protein [Alkalihalophilus]ADC52385.1 hypothetical protein BpOF4_21949 [Alkalihalophilus pseudofirmus OF4]MED1603438.1 hypothetical protein [Alkalihalophilus marmarensis]